MLKKIINVISLLVTACGALLYAFMVYIWTIEWRQSGISEQSYLEKIWFLVENVIFVSGLPPLLIAIYFLLLRKSTTDKLYGFLFVGFFIVAHYFTSAFAAHTPASIHVPIQLTELLAVVGLITLWRKRFPAARNGLN